MGDRANIVVKMGEGNADVFLYTHWNGYCLPSVLQQALRRKQRWDEASYLTRIIFCEMVKGRVEEETGFGISSYRVDTSHDFFVVDPNAQTVSVRDPDGKKEDKVPP